MVPACCPRLPSVLKVGTAVTCAGCVQEELPRRSGGRPPDEASSAARFLAQVRVSGSRPGPRDRHVGEVLTTLLGRAVVGRGSTRDQDPSRRSPGQPIRKSKDLHYDSSLAGGTGLGGTSVHGPRRAGVSRFPLLICSPARDRLLWPENRRSLVTLLQAHADRVTLYARLRNSASLLQVAESSRGAGLGGRQSACRREPAPVSSRPCYSARGRRCA